MGLHETPRRVVASPAPPAETLAVQHARKQGAADGFQAGWKAAIVRASAGESLKELRELVPVGPDERAEKFLLRVAETGGAIVSSGSAHEIEIADARARGDWLVIDGFGFILDRLRSGGSVAAPGFLKPEGIVIYLSAARTYFKQTLEKDDEPKSRDVKRDPVSV